MGLYFLFYAKPKHISNYFLGAMLIALSIRIGKSVFFYFNPDLAYGYLQFGLMGCLFIGPFLYFYIKSIVDNGGIISKTWIYHILILSPVAAVICYFYSFGDNPDDWRCYIIPGIYYLWLGYILLTAFCLKDLIKDLFNKNVKFKNIEKWMLSVFIGNVFIWAAYNFAGYGSYILGALLFSFMLYLFVLLLFFRGKQDSIIFGHEEKYKNKKIAVPKANELLEKLNAKIQGEELFKNPNLKIADVAKKMNVLPHTISQLLNDNLGKGFPQYLNEFRIEEAKKLILSGSLDTYESIGYDCGFNSKSTFFSSFKKITGSTPAKFKSFQENDPIIGSDL